MKQMCLGLYLQPMRRRKVSGVSQHSIAYVMLYDLVGSSYLGDRVVQATRGKLAS